LAYDPRPDESLTIDRDEPLDPERERARLASALVSGAGELEDQFDAAHLLQSFADLLVRYTPHFPLVWFYIGDPANARITPQYCAGAEREYGEGLVVDRSALMMRGPVRRALETGETVIQQIPRQLGATAWLLPGVRGWHRRALQAGVRSVMALPLPLSDRSDWGLTVIYADTVDYFDRVGVEPVETLGRMVRVGLDRIALRAAEHRTRQDLERTRLEDPVTGLANQAGLEAAWAQKTDRDDGQSLVVQLDIDDFTALDAGLGRQASDGVLRAVAERLRQHAGEHGIVARCGADAFLLGVLIANDSDPEAFVEGLQNRVGESLIVAGRELALSATAGYTVHAVSRPLRHDLAAMAQREARAEGPGTRRRQSEELTQVAAPPQDLYAQLRHAIDDNQLALFYQPQVDLCSPHTVVGAEALVRWYRSDGTLVPPGDFIPAVEGSALIRDIGCWVMAATAARLTEQASARLPVLGLNIGARHLLHPRFLEDVDAVLARFPEVASRLAVEITESAAMTDMEGTKQVVVALRERGLTVALDDFGTGFASYSQLAALPVDQIKIDREFIDGLDADPRRLALVESLMVAAEGLGIGVVAEGIEQPEEGAILADIGCPVGQGYGYARPMDGVGFTEWLAQRRCHDAKRPPIYQPIMGVIHRQRAAVRAAAGPMPDMPDWFHRLFPGHEQAQAVHDALLAYQQAWPGDEAARQRLLEKLAALRDHLR